MMTCPACGKENEDSAFECRRCRAPLREDMPEEHPPGHAPAHAQAAPVEPEASSDALGMVCNHCEAYNEPGVRVCTNCGHQLIGAAGPGAEMPQATEPPLDKTPPQPYAAHEEEPAGSPANFDSSSSHDVTPPDGISSLSDELSALAISDEEAAEAGVSTSGNGADDGPASDKTPPQPFAIPVHEEPVRAEPPARSRLAEVAATAAAGVVVAVGVASSRRAPPEVSSAPPAKVPAPAAAPAEKPCSSCGASNPPAAKFCFDCGTPFAKKALPPESKPPEPKVRSKPPEPVRAAPPEPVRSAPPPRPAPKVEPVRAPPPSVQVSPSIHVDEELAESTTESSAVSQEEALPEELLAEELLPEELPAEEAFAAEPLPEPPAEEVPPPFPASLVVEKGAAPGTTFVLAHLENSLGASGTHIELGADPFVAPHAATLLFAEEHLTVRDEGSANGVFVKVRGPWPLEAGDLFVAGERLFRYDGPTELARTDEGETPFLGAPRPQAAAVRVSEVLAAGKTGRTCHRSGPVIAIGRTGCDLNFASDALLAARHAEIRLGEDGSAALVDLGAGPSGVFVRVRTQAQHDLQAGDVLMLGDQLLRLEVS